MTIVVLKFPNARLFVHDLLLTGGISGPQSIVKSACEYGLISPEAMDKVQELTAGHTCPCMAAARNVLIDYFDRKRRMPGLPPVNTEEVWAAVEKEALTYKKATNLESGEQCCTRAESHDCLKFAPALFDIMLQQIRRYP